MRLLRLLFPPKCVLCRRVLWDEETGLCRSCRTEEVQVSGRRKKIPFLADYTALWYYEGNPRQSLLRFKFGDKRSYADTYGPMLAMKLLSDRQEHYDLLTWVPVSAGRRRKRGYDQSQLLAQAVGKELGIEPCRLLTKFRNNRPQSTIRGDAQRRANVLGVYRMEKADVAGKTILLIDDILTTGATAGECARMLLTAGAAKVYLAVAAIARNSEKPKKGANS